MAKKKTIISDYHQLEKAVWQLVEPVVEDLHSELIDVEYTREAGSNYLRLFIDRASAPVDHNLCQAVSERVGDLLDQADPIAENYYLEVSSPGLERPLKRPQDFQRYQGRLIAIRLYAARAGQKEFRGILQGLQEEQLILSGEAGELRFSLEEVAKAHLIAEF